MSDYNRHVICSLDIGGGGGGHGKQNLPFGTIFFFIIYVLLFSRVHYLIFLLVF